MPRDVKLPDYSVSKQKQLGEGATTGGPSSNIPTTPATVVPIGDGDEGDFLQVVDGVAEFAPIPDNIIIDEMLSPFIKIGNLDDLNTTADSNIVAAINELEARPIGLPGEGTPNHHALWLNDGEGGLEGVQLGESRLMGATTYGYISLFADPADDRPLIFAGGEEVESTLTGEKIMELVGSGLYTTRFVNTGDGYGLFVYGRNGGSLSDALVKIHATHGNHGLQSYQTGLGRSIRAEIVNIFNSKPAIEASTTGSGPAIYANGSEQKKTREIATADADKTVKSDDNIIIVNAAGGTMTITLPTVANYSGRILTVVNKLNNATTVTISAATTQTINGAASINMASAYGNRKLLAIPGGTNWVVI